MSTSIETFTLLVEDPAIDCGMVVGPKSTMSVKFGGVGGNIAGIVVDDDGTLAEDSVVVEVVVVDGSAGGAAGMGGEGQAGLWPVNVKVYVLCSPEHSASQHTRRFTVVGPHFGYVIVV